MENSKAIEILNSLADGIDPFTHILFPPDSPYQQADRRNFAGAFA